MRATRPTEAARPRTTTPTPAATGTRVRDRCVPRGRLRGIEPRRLQRWQCLHGRQLQSGDGSCTSTGDDTNTCSDGNACTQTDACVSGACVGSNPVFCADDGNACTDDACNPADGSCTHPTDNTNTCSDGNACTQTDTCVSGACVGSNPIVCNDGNACTDDSCNTGNGNCIYTSDDTNACSDGEPVHADRCLPGGRVRRGRTFWCATTTTSAPRMHAMRRPAASRAPPISPGRDSRRRAWTAATSWSWRMRGMRVRETRGTTTPPTSIRSRRHPAYCVDLGRLPLFMNSFGQTCP
jgi:hypothetical protein